MLAGSLRCRSATAGSCPTEFQVISVDITVVGCDWGGARPSNIEVLLTNVACHLTRVIREPPTGSIVVRATLRIDDDPMTLFRSCLDEPFTILLSARGRHWSQIAYQFSHELCHVLSGYERLRDNRNNWFHEAICELASIFTIRRMAEAWATRPPYPNWAGYARSLTSYAETCLAKDERRLPAGMTLSTWLLSEEEGLREDCRQRDKNAVVAYSLLPIFENEPTVWNAIRRLPDSSVVFRDYMLEWHRWAEPAEKPLVERICDAFR